MTEDKLEDGKYPNQIGFYPQENSTIIWDYFRSTFDCPYTVERVGRIGDGGKWVCGLRELTKKSNCVVYSFGVNDDTSFEEEILERTHCVVHMFDPTVEGSTLPVLQNFPGRITFSKLGLAKEDHGDYRTLRTFMKRNGDSFADILKIDIEGGEWEAMTEVLANNQIQLPFGQLQLEIHLDRLLREYQYVGFRSFWTALEDAGLRPFHDEPNLLTDFGMYLYHEFSFINTKSTESLFSIAREPVSNPI